MTYKSIFKGRLEFGSPKSFDKVLTQYKSRVENYYKNDVLIDEEEVFDASSSSMIIPRLINTSCSEKTWKNTVSLLIYISQYAVAGEFGAWLIDSGKVIYHRVIEPQSDRAAVQAFLKGRALVEEKGKQDEAIAELTKAINKFDRHALAYERRGRVNHMLKNYEDAIYDYTKSIDLNPANTSPYFGRGIIHAKNDNLEKAIADFDLAIKTSIPLQSIYWQAHKRKALCHLATEDYEGAFNNLKFYSKRKFKPGDTNQEWQKFATFHYGRALLLSKNYTEAVDVFKQVETMETAAHDIDPAELLYYKALALKKSGKTGYRKDAKQAAKLGFVKASELLV